MSTEDEKPEKRGMTVRRIFVVDDQFENRYLLKALLEGSGYQVILAENGLDALEKLKTESVDAIISDILMPVMDGYKLCRTIREDPSYTHTPFIFYTASYTEKKDRDFGLSLGADGYITKPIDPEAFIATVNDVFARFTAGDEKEASPPSQLTFYQSYSDILEKKLNKKLVELDQEREAVHLSEEKYHHFFKILQGIGYLLQIGSSRYRSFEGPALEITGYAAQEFRDGERRWEEMLHPDDKERYLTERAKAESQPGTTFSLQYRIIHRDGEVRWVHETAMIFSVNEPGTPGMVMMQGAIHDNTPQIRSNELLRISEEHYRFLFENMAEGAVYHDTEGRILDANVAAEQILGLPLSELLGMNCSSSRWRAIREDFSSLPGEEHPALVTLRTGQQSSGTLGVLNARDHQYHWILVHAVPIFYHQREDPVQVFTTFVDITQEQNAKNALFIREKQYRELVESISDTLFTLNSAGEFIYVSPVVRTNFGYDPMQVVGHSYLDFIHKDDQKSVREWFDSTFRNQIYPMEFRGYNARHQIGYYRVIGSPIWEGDVIAGISGIISDITAWKENETIRAYHTREIQGLLSLHLLTQESTDRILSYTLAAAGDITESSIGCIASITKTDKMIRLQAWSPESLKIWSAGMPSDREELSRSPLFRECIESKQPLILNDPRQIRERLPFADDSFPGRILAVPIVDREMVVAIVAVAGTAEPYSDLQVNSLKTLGHTLWEIINRRWADLEIKNALCQIATNMEQMATLNDTIRNPLSIIAGISDVVDPESGKYLLSAVENIDSVITMLDRGWVQSEKVRNFLIKHYQFTNRELSPINPSPEE